MPVAPKFTIQLNSLFLPNVRYVADSGSVRVYMDKICQRMSTPSKHQWAGFKRLCDFLEIENWLEDYGDEESDRNGRDGLPWELEFVVSKLKTIRSRGVYDYPSLEDPKLSSCYMDRLGLLLHFIDFSLLNSRIDGRDVYG